MSGVQVCGEAASGEEAIELIERVRPHLALLDLQMPEVGGLDVVRRLPADRLPLVAFVTAFDDFAIEAFEVNAIDYVLKPAERTRVQATLDRARQRLQRANRRGYARPPWRARPRPTNRAHGVRTWSACRCDGATRWSSLSVRQIAFVESEGELLHITTVANERYTLTHRLHALEARLDPRRFVRLGRGTLANLDLISRVSPMPGGTYTATLSNGHQLPVSRIQSRILRDTLLKL